MATDFNLTQRASWLISILNRVLASATEELLLSPGSEPAELDDPIHLRGLSEERREQLFNLILRASQNEPRESVIGLPQIKADEVSHARIAAFILADEPDAVVVGEEATRESWDEWERCVPGTVIYSVDSIDGSAPYDSLAFGYSANLLMYVRMADGTDTLLMTITVNSSQLALVYQVPNQVLCSYGDRTLRPLVEPVQPLHTVRPGFTALVGAQPHARRGSAPLFDTTRSWGLPPLESGGVEYPDPSLTIFTLGGAPAALGLAIGRLDALVCTEFQTVHDTPGILPLLAIGLACYGPQGPVDAQALKRQFNQLDRPESDNYKPIPPMVLGRDPQLTQLIADGLFSGARWQLVAVEESMRPALRVVDLRGGQADLRDEEHNSPADR